MNPKTYPAFTKATGIKVKKDVLRLERDAAREAQGRRPRLRPAVPDGLHEKVLIAEKLLEPIDWSKLPNVKKNIDPKFRNAAVRPEGPYSVVEGLGHDRLHVPHGQDQGAADDLARVRQPREESTRAR